MYYTGGLSPVPVWTERWQVSQFMTEKTQIPPLVKMIQFTDTKHAKNISCVKAVFRITLFGVVTRPPSLLTSLLFVLNSISVGSCPSIRE